MQIVKIYNSSCDLRYKNKNVFKTVDRFLCRYPAEYRKQYDINLQTLELWRCDELFNKEDTGGYLPKMNIILYVTNGALGHELFHLASYDREKGINSFSGCLDIEEGLIEGMTEYLYMKAFGLDGPTSYEFETFAVAMLSDVPDIFKYHFIPSFNDFISLFPSRRDIYNLLFATNSYSEKCSEFYAFDENDKDKFDVREMWGPIEKTIDNLISIELSFEKDNGNLKAYREKFMDLLGTSYVRNVVLPFYPRYLDYAGKQLKERILRR